jgi:hypothetical protein
MALLATTLLQGDRLVDENGPLNWRVAKLEEDTLLTEGTMLFSGGIGIPMDPPIVNVISASFMKLSDEPGKDAYSYSFQSNMDVDVWEVRVVPSSGSTHTEGVLVESGGLANANATISGSITFAELLAAGQAAEGSKTLKFFVRDTAGNWSV